MVKHIYFDSPNTIFLDEPLEAGFSGVYCGKYEVTQEQIDFGFAAHPGEEIQIDYGKKLRFQATDPGYLEEQKKLSIKLQLNDIDSKKIRAITDYILSGDNSRLESLENQAIELRSKL